MDYILRKLELGAILDPEEGAVHCKYITGLPNAVTFHLWNWVIILDSFSKYILFNTNLFGTYTTRKGILSMYSQ